MERVVRVVAALALGALVLLASTPNAGAQASEWIRSYDVRIEIRADDSLRITETIVYDFGSSPHHGIFRDVPTTYRYDDRYDRVTPLHVESVSASAGTPAQYDVSDISGGRTEIKIGDPDRTITGVHTYRLVYTVDDALNGFRDHDELYWNAVGDEWSVPVERATAVVDAPGTIQAAVCAAGPVGSVAPCDHATARGDTARFAQGSLGPYEALTVAVALPKGVVADPHPQLRERWSLDRAFTRSPATLGSSGALLLLLVGGFGWLLWRRGRDRRFVGSPVDQVMGTEDGSSEPVPLLDRTVTPVEFAPPEDLKPGQVGTIVDERANTLDVTATIIDLAVRGYLTIEEIPKEGIFGKPDWTLHRTDKADDDLMPYERTLLTSLFETGNDVKLSSLKRTFSAHLTKVEQELYADALKRGWFLKRPDKVRGAWHGIGVALVLLGCLLTYTLARWTHAGLLGVAVLVGGIAVLIGARWMSSKTAKGTAIARRVAGFRTVIETAETHMARWAEQQNVFTRFLPYAIVFGCTEKWAKAFEGLAQMPPDTTWYLSSRPFVYTDFGRTLDDFAVTTGGMIASTPAGSGGSGFGGGGFSGGGMGGGGGGSW